MGGSFNEGNSHEIKRGPWTPEEDNLLVHYITCHGEGRWNSLAKSSGLKRTGKSCRLRWLNYLKPDVKRGNLSPHEQLLILELHSKWGNRWSKIACQLPGRTDNEIKNYWRTRVQKQARHLKIDSNSKIFVETLRRFWMPRLFEKIEQNSSSSPSSSPPSSPSTSTSTIKTHQNKSFLPQAEQTLMPSSSPSSSSSSQVVDNKNPNSSSRIFSSESMAMVSQDSNLKTNPYSDCYHVDNNNFDMGFIHLDMQNRGQGDMSALEFQMAEADWMKNDDLDITFWNMDELHVAF